MWKLLLSASFWCSEQAICFIVAVLVSVALIMTRSNAQRATKNYLNYRFLASLKQSNENTQFWHSANAEIEFRALSEISSV